MELKEALRVKEEQKALLDKIEKPQINKKINKRIK